jgi:hypothetical protein
MLAKFAEKIKTAPALQQEDPESDAGWFQNKLVFEEPAATPANPYRPGSQVRDLSDPRNEFNIRKRQSGKRPVSDDT